MAANLDGREVVLLLMQKNGPIRIRSHLAILVQNQYAPLFNFNFVQLNLNDKRQCR